MHKHTRLLPYQRREAYRRWLQGEKVTVLSKHFGVSRQTLYAVFKKARLEVFANYSSMNERYRSIAYGLRRLSQTERVLAKKLAKRERRLNRYEKSEPGELVHFDTKKLPLLSGEAIIQPREWLHVAVDDHSRWLYADIFPDKTSWSSAIHLEETIRAMPFRMEATYSDNGSEYRGRSDHAFVATARRHGIGQRFTRPHTPRTNGKAERVIKTLMTEWHRRRSFLSREERRKFLYAYTRYYNQVRPHQSLLGQSPIGRLEAYLARLKSVRNP